MPQYHPLNVQCFVKRPYQPVFTGENDPRLLFISRVSPDASAHPRVMHAHNDFVEIVLICSGMSEYLLDDKKQYIRAGDLLVYNAGMVHDEISGPDIAVGSYCIGIGGLHVPGLRENALIPEGKGCIFPTGDDFNKLETLCEMIYGSLTADEPQTEAFCNSLLHALLVKVLAITGGAPVQPPADEPDVLSRRMKDYIDAHYMEPLTLQAIGETLHASPYYLSHVFKKKTGYAPMQYLLRRRIGEAQTLLLMTDLPVARIAEMVGYETQSYFNLQFTKYVGMPPGRYRQNYIVPPGNTSPEGRKPKPPGQR
ncbi:MAG: AraC family transcriptional regulator [Butyricicoccus sp.]